MSVALIAAYAASLVAQPADPIASLSGTWELNLAASDMASDHPKPDYRVTRTISATGGALTVTDHMANLWLAGHDIPVANVAIKVVPDGVEHDGSGATRMPLFPSATAVVKAAWQGNNLAIAASGNDMLGTWASERRLFVSADGSQLTEIDVDTSGVVESRRTLVFVRSK